MTEQLTNRFSICEECANQKSKVEMIGNCWSGTVVFCGLDQEPDETGECDDFKAKLWTRVMEMFRSKEE